MDVCLLRPYKHWYFAKVMLWTQTYIGDRLRRNWWVKTVILICDCNWITLQLTGINAIRETTWRSLTVINNGTIQQITYYFLLVIYSNHVSLSFTFSQKLPIVRHMQLHTTLSLFMTVKIIGKWQFSDCLWIHPSQSMLYFRKYGI